MLTTLSRPLTNLPARPNPRYSVRPVTSNDFKQLQRLEREIWGSQGEAQLCPHYLRMCTEQFADVCFIGFDGEIPIGYVLNVMRERTAHCGTLAVHADYRRSRITYLLVAAMADKFMTLGIDDCWFTVSPDNLEARQVHLGLGAKVIAERTDYYGPGDTRLLSRIDFSNSALRARFTRHKGTAT